VPCIDGLSIVRGDGAIASDVHRISAAPLRFKFDACGAYSPGPRSANKEVNLLVCMKSRCVAVIPANFFSTKSALVMGLAETGDIKRIDEIKTTKTCGALLILPSLSWF
jgi:hypothetical protein